MTGPHPDPLALDAHLEPSALHAGFDVREPIVSALSQAVSLKRIADALEILAEAATVPNVYGEGPIEAIGANIARALR